jgi:hypothetical protein
MLKQRLAIVLRQPLPLSCVLPLIWVVEEEEEEEEEEVEEE